jgi:TMEM175 potassium channel family protein
MPFPTALLAEYLLHPEATVAANLYTGTFLAISLAFDALWRHASDRKQQVRMSASNSQSVGRRLVAANINKQIYW